MQQPAENTIKLKLVAGSLALDYAVDQIMKGLKSSRFHIIPGRKARMTYWIGRLVPHAIVRTFVDNTVARTLKETA